MHTEPVLNTIKSAIKNQIFVNYFDVVSVLYSYVVNFQFSNPFLTSAL